MKKISSLFSLLLLLVASSSCSDEGSDMIWDINPIDIRINFVDADGNPVFDTDIESSPIGIPVEIEYLGKTYPLEDWDKSKYTNALYQYKPQSRAYLPNFQGTYLLYENTAVKENDEEWIASTGTGAAILCFGELDGAEDHDTDIKISFPSLGKAVTIHLFSRVRIKGDNVNVSRRITDSNGKEIATTPIAVTSTFEGGTPNEPQLMS